MNPWDERVSNLSILSKWPRAIQLHNKPDSNEEEVFYILQGRKYPSIEYGITQAEFISSNEVNFTCVADYIIDDMNYIEPGKYYKKLDLYSNGTLVSSLGIADISIIYNIGGQSMITLGGFPLPGARRDPDINIRVILKDSDPVYRWMSYV